MWVSIALMSFCRCATPKRCCSSMMTRARRLNCTSFCIIAWVPTIIASSPEAIHFFNCAFDILVGLLGFVFEGYLRHSLPPMNPMWSGRWLKRCMRVLNCCLASTSVGVR